tara:strand:+ start:201 stop:572 length:372 start_codon:yes stop_codon:yes gene_type:complete
MHFATWKLLPIILASSFLLSACSTIIPVVKTEKVVIQIKERPRKLELGNVYFYVVTPDNYKEFIAKFERQTGTDVYYAISVRDYEIMSTNFTDITRYIKQSNEILVYYETLARDTTIEKRLNE